MSSTCVVLAGGFGSRLRSEVGELPKCLAPIQGRPFIEWQLRSLLRRGVEHFVLSLGYGARDVLKALEKPWARGLSIECVIEPTVLGTGGAVQFALRERSLDEALVVNGDTFIGGALDGMFTPLKLTQGELMRVAIVNVTDRTRFGGVDFDPYQRVTAFSEKGRSGAGAINAGLYRIHRLAFENRTEGAFSLETQVMQRLVKTQALTVSEIMGPFIDIGIPSDYRLFASGLRDYVGES